MPTDALLALAGTSSAPLTKTATFNGTPLVLAAGTPRRGLKARVVYSAASTSAGAGSATFALAVSYDGGSTFTDIFFALPITLGTTATSGEIFIPFEVTPTSVANGIQVRLDLQAISGTTATITYFSDPVIARP